MRGQRSAFNAPDSPLAGAATLQLAAGVEADDHTPPAEVSEAPGQVGVKTLKAAHSQLAEEEGCWGGIGK